MTQAVVQVRNIVARSGFANPLTLGVTVSAASYVKVYADNIQLVSGDDYEITGIGDPNGISIEIIGAEDVDNYVGVINFVAVYDPPLDQQTDLSAGGVLGRGYESGLDQQNRRMQALGDRVSRALKMDVPIGADIVLPWPPEDGKTLLWDDDLQRFYWGDVGDGGGSSGGSLPEGGAAGDTLEKQFDDSVVWTSNPGGLSVLAAGAAGTGGANDAAAINAAALELSAAGGGTLYFPPGRYFTGDTTVYIPGNVNVAMGAGAYLEYEGSGIGLHIDGGASITRWGKYDVSIVRKTREWHDGNDSTSVGVRLTNIRNAQVNVQRIEKFFIGLQPYGDATGTVECTFHLGLIRDNKTGIAPGRVNGGWANQNTYIGGSVVVTQAITNLPGFPTRLIDTGLENGNTFIGVNLEGFAATPSYAVYNSGNYNAFEHCRYELQGAGTFYIPAGVFGTYIIGGYSQFGGDAELIDDDSGRTTVFGSLGSLFRGDDGSFGGAALVAQGRGSAASIVFQTRDLNGITFFEVEGDGNVRLYDAGGKGVVDNASIILSATNSSLDFGDASGVSVPVAAIRAAGTTLSYINKYHRMSATGTRGVEWVALANLATSIVLSAGTGFLTQGTTALATLSGGVDGQEFFVKAGASGATITAGANFKTKSGSDLVLAAGQVAKFMAVSGSVAWEL